LKAASSDAIASCAEASAARTPSGAATFPGDVGCAFILARVTEDPHEADRILADVRGFLRASLDRGQD
jgi:hypothetical protein